MLLITEFDGVKYTRVNGGSTFPLGSFFPPEFSGSSSEIIGQLEKFEENYPYTVDNGLHTQFVVEFATFELELDEEGYQDLAVREWRKATQAELDHVLNVRLIYAQQKKEQDLLELERLTQKYKDTL